MNNLAPGQVMYGTDLTLHRRSPMKPSDLIHAVARPTRDVALGGNTLTFETIDPPSWYEFPVLLTRPTPDASSNTTSGHSSRPALLLPPHSLRQTQDTCLLCRRACTHHQLWLPPTCYARKQPVCTVKRSFGSIPDHHMPGTPAGTWRRSPFTP